MLRSIVYVVDGEGDAFEDDQTTSNQDVMSGDINNIKRRLNQRCRQKNKEKNQGTKHKERRWKRKMKVKQRNKSGSRLKQDIFRNYGNQKRVKMP